MKKYNGFLPRNIAQESVWGTNFSSTLGRIAALLNVTAEETTATKTISQKLSDSVHKVEAKRTEWKEATGSRDEAKLEFETFIRAMVAKIKAHAAYTEAMGKDLGIVDQGQVLDKNSIFPTLKLEAFRGYVSVKFNKKRMVGVTIYSRIKGSNGWDKVANATKSPYHDLRPLAIDEKAETREYMALCYDGANDIGKQSDIGTVVFGG
jgi:hypothetical protein